MKLAACIFAMGCICLIAGCGTSTSGATGGAVQSTSSSSSQATSGKPLKVVFFYDDPANTPGWESTFEQARHQLDEEFGNKISTSYVVSPDGPNSPQAITNLVQNGANLIIDTSYYGNDFNQAAKKYPNVHFLTTEGTIPSGVSNAIEYDMAAEDGWYLSGMAVGAVMKNAHKTSAGWVDGYAIPYDLRQIDGFTLGMQRMDPGATTHVVLTNSWYDPNKEAQAANSLVAIGVGSLNEGINSPVVAKAAEQAGLPMSGVYPLTTFAPNSAVTGPEYQWAAIFAPAIKMLLDGQTTWKPTLWYYGAHQGAITISAFGKMFQQATSAQKNEIEQAAEQLTAGKLVVLPGTADQLESLNYVVPGVRGVPNVKTVAVSVNG
jgi:basic membrane protein A and related proteins